MKSKDWSVTSEQRAASHPFLIFLLARKYAGRIIRDFFRKFTFTFDLVDVVWDRTAYNVFPGMGTCSSKNMLSIVIQKRLSERKLIHCESNK